MDIFTAFGLSFSAGLNAYIPLLILTKSMLPQTIAVTGNINIITRKIIAITSVSAKQPLENLVLSNTTRLGVVGYAKTLANEYAKDNILVNVVCPGPNLTDRMKEIIKKMSQDTGKSEAEVEKLWTDQIPLGRLGTPVEFANLIVFLASEKASYITGTVIQVDGGFVKGTL